MSAEDEEQAQDLLTRVVLTAPDPVWILNESFELCAYNDAFQQMMKKGFGLPIQPGLSVDNLPGPIARTHRAWYEKARAGETTRSDFQLPQGGEVFEVQVRPFPMASGTGVAVWCRDVTFRKQRALALKREAEAAQQADQTKSDFLAQISHEIRTPLNAIAGLTDLAAAKNNAPDTQALLERVQLNAAGLVNMVNDLLDVSKLDANLMDLNVEATRVHALVSQVYELLRNRAEAKGLDYELIIDDDVPIRVLGDAQRIRQVVTNLLGNAIKYTREGKVSVHVKVAHTDAEQVTLQLDVKDTGVGIPRRDQELIFSKFYRSYRSTTGRTSGTGLGLFITHSLVKLMNGKVRLKSQLGKGSTFMVRLPLHKLPDHTEAEQRLRRPIIVLVVDDNADNRTLASRLLTTQGDVVVEAEDGIQALRILGSQKFDVVLMDVDMPRMNGLDTTKQFRIGESRLRQGRTPILAVTAHATGRVKQQCLAAGMDDFLTKPIYPEVLKEQVEEWVDRTPRILVVDDAKDAQLIIQGAVEGSGGRLSVAKDLAVARQMLHTQTFDLVVSDYHLPDGTGVELAKQFSHQVPFLAFSGKVDSGRQWKDAGALELLKKPARIHEVTSAIERALFLAARIRGQQDVQLQPLSEMPTIVETRPKTSLGPISRPPEVDDDLADLIPVFLARYRAELPVMENALKKGDYRTIARIAHQMKGTGTSFGFPRVTELGGLIEERAEDDDFDAIARHLQELQEIFSA